MNWSMGSDSAQIWMVVLSVVVALGLTTALVSLLMTWKKRSVDEEPLPHCNLEERLSQITQSTMLQAKKPA